MPKEHHISNYQLGKIMRKAWPEFREEKRTRRARLLLSEGIPEGAPLMETFDNLVKEKFPDLLQEEKEKLQELANFTTSANKLLDLVKKGQLEFGKRGPLGWQAVSLTQNSLVSIIVLDCNRESPINSSMIITFEKDTLEVEINNFRNAEQNSVGHFFGTQFNFRIKNNQVVDSDRNRISQKPNCTLEQKSFSQTELSPEDFEKSRRMLGEILLDLDPDTTR